jgi:hypothetical protein
LTAHNPAWVVGGICHGIANVPGRRNVAVRGLPILSDPFLHLFRPPESLESLGVLPEPSDFTLFLLDSFHLALTVKSLLTLFPHMCSPAFLARFP